MGGNATKLRIQIPIQVLVKIFELNYSKQIDLPSVYELIHYVYVDPFILCVTLKNH